MIEQKELVSVIVPCYNQGMFLAECLDSLLCQTYTNYECIIVNDGSTDNSAGIAELYTSRDSRIKLLSIPNGGVSNARNIGIRQSSGTYILPLDGDDKISPSYIEEAVDILNSNSDIDIVYCKATFFGKKKGKWHLPEYSLEQMLGCNCLFCSAMYRRSLYDKTKGYNLNMKTGYEDWDFWLSMIENGAKIFRINKELFSYRIRSRSRQKSITNDQTVILRRQIYENHRDLYNSHFFNPLCSFEYLNIADSIEYKLGKVLLKPIRFIYELF